MGDHEDYENSLEAKPLEFLASIADTGGRCDGQTIVPEGDHYKCWCSCGWEVQAPTQQSGLHLARVHTGSVPA